VADDGTAGTRSARAVAIVVVAVVLALALLSTVHPRAGRAAVATRSRSRPSAARHHHSTTTTTLRATIPPSEIHLQVLNGLISGTLSAEFSDALHLKYGYLTGAPADTTRTETASAIYVVTGGYLAEAEVLARQVGLPTTDIVTATPTTADGIPAGVLADSNLVLVVGQALAAKGPPTDT